MNRNIRRYQGVIYVVVISAIVVALRFHDVRGSYFPDSYNFEQTNGVILESEIKKGIKPAYRFHIVYEYQIAGEKYKSSRVGFGFKGSRYKESVEEIIIKYPVGSHTSVYYSRSNVDFSVLNPEMNDRKGFNLLILLFLVCFSGAVYLGKKNV
ncbi:DUF3592 domain-containing protein [Microbulbifer agarilyticus]|uniref:DUF3592 domain-containing protein n=1 Tax=Microbulbifer agarilyticus TaxID=260552 RepID=UPI001C968660|nr:DUF3592 domain-containing protein [Microbulbifer agarilyticus]MBY6213263.1 DUF3592 domain-containing protein [Microbulbifer agarilyticus]